jgi:hypothetical protein
VATIAGVDLRHVVAPEAGCHCTNCRGHRGEVQCVVAGGCGEWYLQVRGHGTIQCRSCGMRSCVEHQHNRVRCAGCGDRHDFWDWRTGLPTDPAPLTPCPDCQELICVYCSDPDNEEGHECAEDGDEGADSDEDNSCSHSCCVDCCRARGCDLEAAGWNLSTDF